ncbi:MAG: insulinase family protein [Phycisphaerae bacterium]|nr:insulinase family protein [Phycisphaerae bacterium]
MQRIHTHEYDNGLKLLVEPHQGVASCGLTWLLPAGVVCEPPGGHGTCTLLSELMFRGAGDRDARAHSDALDGLGVQRSTEAQPWHLALQATMMGARLPEALPLLVDMVSSPHLDADAFEPTRQLALQSLEALEDDPQEKVIVELKERFLGDPLGRSVYGRGEDLRALAVEDVRAFKQHQLVPHGAILGVAGAVDFPAVRDLVGRLLDGWSGDVDLPEARCSGPGGHHHVPAETAQEHIGVAHFAPAEPDPQSMVQRLGIAVLSGGMSGRLFTEVREKRGLCYAVHAMYAAGKEIGAVLAYAGSTPQQAPETLEVLVEQLQGISEGVTPDEFQRAVVGLKSRLVMQGESTSARAAAIARDQYLLDHPRTLDEIATAVDAITVDQLNAFLAGHRPDRFTTLALGPQPLAAPVPAG